MLPESCPSRVYLVVFHFYFKFKILCSCGLKLLMVNKTHGLTIHDHAIIYTGLSSRRNSAITFHGSPESAAPTEGGLISVQYYHSISPSDVKEHGSESPRYVTLVIS